MVIKAVAIPNTIAAVEFRVMDISLSEKMSDNVSPELWSRICDEVNNDIKIIPSNIAVAITINIEYFDPVLSE